jgi:hypothetical protein
MQCLLLLNIIKKLVAAVQCFQEKYRPNLAKVARVISVGEVKFRGRAADPIAFPFHRAGLQQISIAYNAIISAGELWGRSPLSVFNLCSF